MAQLCRSARTRGGDEEVQRHPLETANGSTSNTPCCKKLRIRRSCQDYCSVSAGSRTLGRGSDVVLGREQQDLVCVQDESPPNIEERGRTSHLGLVCVSGACQLWVVAEHPVDYMSPPEAALAGRETLPKHTKCICGICWVRGYIFL